MFHGVEDAIVAHAHPEAIAACQGLAAGRDGIGSQRINGGAEFAVEGAVAQAFEELRGALTQRDVLRHRIGL